MSDEDQWLGCDRKEQELIQPGAVIANEEAGSAQRLSFLLVAQAHEPKTEPGPEADQSMRDARVESHAEADREAKKT